MCRAYISVSAASPLVTRKTRWGLVSDLSGPPGLDGGGQAVGLVRVGSCRLLVEAIQSRPDEVSLAIGPRQGEQGAELFLLTT